MSKGATVQVLDRGLDILEQLATSERGMSIQELSVLTGLPKPTIHRILATFLERHYVEKDRATSIYKLGYIIVELSSIYLNKIDLKTEAQPIMRRMASAFNTTCFLGIREGLDVVYLAAAEPLNSIRMYTQIGKREPLYCTALGKVLMSSMAEEDFSLLARQFSYKPYTSRTIRDYETLSREVREAKNNGYALDRGEHTEASSCLAVPVYDFTRKMIAAISVSGYGLLENHSIETIFKEMKNASQEISRRMGFPFSDTFTQLGGNI